MKHLKQTLAILLTLLMLATAVPFTAFAAECTHQWTSTDFSAGNMAEPATCKSAAKYYYRCTKCGISAKDVESAKNKIVADPNGQVDPNNHPADKLRVSKEAVPPTCMNSGWTAEKTCDLCGKVAEEATQVPSDLSAHKSADGKVVTCTEGIVCAYCNRTIPKDETKHPADQITEIKAGKEPTCGEAGYKAILYCNACKKTTQTDEVLAATGKHTGGTATCSKKAVCTVCKQEYGSFDTTKHDLEHHDAVSVSCTNNGSREYWQCKDCHKFFTDANGTTETTEAALVIQADGKTHDLKKVAAKAASCKAEGNIEYWVCNTCGHFYSDKDGKTEITEAQTVVAKTDHTWGDWVYPDGYKCADGGKVTRTCSVCGEKDEKNANPGEHVDLVTEKRVEPTCTEAGKTEKIYCRKCGVVVTAPTELPATGHNYENAKATGKGDGTHTLACTVCGKAGDPIACVDEDKDCKCDVCKQQLAHVFTNYVSDNNATCAADGTKTALCDVCGKGKDTVVDEGSKTSAAHQYEWVNLNDATCIANGHEKGTCSVCGAETLREIADSAKGHVESDWLYPEGFDCEIGGTRYKKCTVCGDIMTTETIEGHAHSEVIDPEVPKTCTTDGKSAGIHCDVCGKIIKAQAIYKAEGHKANENGFVTTRPATCTEDGVQTATCGVCGETFSEPIPKTGHTFVDTIVKPTCEGAGYTLHKCTVCGYEYKDNISSATGHKMKETITPATTESNGKSVQVCSVCGKKLADKIYRIKSVKLSQTTFARSSKKNTPSVIVTDTKGNKLQKNVDYTVKYASGRKAVGTYKVVVTFKGDYSGKKTLKFKVVPPVVKSFKAKAGTRSATLTWERNKFADMYVIYRATTKDGKFKKIATTQDLTYTATKLTSGKVYYFKVVAVRKLESGNYYSADSAIKKVTVK